MQAPWLENTAGPRGNPVWDFSGVVSNLLGRPPLRVRFMLGIRRTLLVCELSSCPQSNRSTALLLNRNGSIKINDVSVISVVSCLWREVSTFPCLLLPCSDTCCAL